MTLQRRRVKIVRPETIDPDETWAKINNFPEALAHNMPEGQLQEHCEDVARAYGWTCYHETDSRKSDKGLPDLIMVSPVGLDGGVTLAMLELKTMKGKPTADQELWLGRLEHVDLLVTGLIRPADWPRFISLCFDPRVLTTSVE